MQAQPTVGLRIRAYVIVASLLGACSTWDETRTAWHDTTGAGRGYNELQTDSTPCERLRQETIAVGPATYRSPHAAYFDCMQARGWQLVHEPPVSARDFCVTLKTKSGDRFTADDGRVVRVERIIGLSKRCTAKYPVLAQGQSD